MIKKNTSLLALTATFTLVSFSSAATYTWNGSASDGDWTNTANWDGGKAPASLSSTSTTADTIIFDATNMPTTNVVTYASGTGQNSALMVFNSGGVFDLDLSTSLNGGFVSQLANNTFLTVGDGVSGGTEDVTVNVADMSSLLRHITGTANFLVCSDGVLNFNSNLELYNDKQKNATFTVAGGSINAVGYLDFQFNDQAGSYIEFTTIGGSFTAAYGGAYTDFSAVKDDTAGNFVNNSGGTLQFVDNGGTFTVTAIPEPGTSALIGGLLTLSCVMLRRRR